MGSLFDPLTEWEKGGRAPDWPRLAAIVAAKGVPLDAIVASFIHAAEKRGRVDENGKLTLRAVPVVRKSDPCTIRLICPEDEPEAAARTLWQDMLVRSACLLAARACNALKGDEGKFLYDISVAPTRHFLGSVFVRPGAPFDVVAAHHPFKHAGLTPGDLVVTASADRAYRNADVARDVHAWCKAGGIDILHLACGRYDIAAAVAGKMLLAGALQPEDAEHAAVWAGVAGATLAAGAAAESKKAVSDAGKRSADRAGKAILARDRKADGFLRGGPAVAEPVLALVTPETEAAVIDSACKSCACVVGLQLQVMTWKRVKAKLESVPGRDVAAAIAAGMAAQAAMGEAVKAAVGSAGAGDESAIGGTGWWTTEEKLAGVVSHFVRLVAVRFGVRGEACATLRPRWSLMDKAKDSIAARARQNDALVEAFEEGEPTPRSVGAGDPGGLDVAAIKKGMLCCRMLADGNWVWGLVVGIDEALICTIIYCDDGFEEEATAAADLAADEDFKVAPFLIAPLRHDPRAHPALLASMTWEGWKFQKE